ncbi:MAG: hypothetical protein ACQEQJ_04660 [Halobacteriota archaeon]
MSGRRWDATRIEKLRRAVDLLVVYLVNLALYAGPLTLAGIGIGSESTVPDWLLVLTGGERGPVLLFVAGFVRNSAYLFGVTVATLLGIHLAVLVTLQSKGVMRTAYSVVYSTSIYLAGLFTVVWYLTTATGVHNARDFVVNVQVEFIYRVIDLTGSEMRFGLARPDTLVPGEFSLVGELSLALLLVLFVYYLYSIYLGTRLNHDAGRFEGVVTVSIVVLLPVLYVVGSIIAAGITNVPFYP